LFGIITVVDSIYYYYYHYQQCNITTEQVGVFVIT